MGAESVNRDGMDRQEQPQGSYRVAIEWAINRIGTGNVGKEFVAAPMVNQRREPASAR